MPNTVERSKTPGLTECKELASVVGPCLSFFFPLEKTDSSARLEASRIQSILRKAEQELTQRGSTAPDIKSLLAPVVEATTEFEENFKPTSGTLVVLRAPDFLRVLHVHTHIDESVKIGRHFHVLPFLKALNEDNQEFYILALSQKHIRLLRCTNHSSEEVTLPESIPTSFETWLNKPHSGGEKGENLQNENGSMLGSFTSPTDFDRKDEYVHNFYRAVDKGIYGLLHEDKTPIVLAGVENELAMYHQLSKGLHLVPDGAHGSPEGLKGGELHRRALELVEKHSKEPIKKAMDAYERAGVALIASDPEAIVKAAFESRIAHLFVREGATAEGTFDPETLRVGGKGEKECLINLSALQTIANGGEVSVGSAEYVPNQLPVAALLRF
jgi:hypothetical protein